MIPEHSLVFLPLLLSSKCNRRAWLIIALGPIDLYNVLQQCIYWFITQLTLFSAAQCDMLEPYTYAVFSAGV